MVRGRRRPEEVMHKLGGGLVNLLEQNMAYSPTRHSLDHKSHTETSLAVRKTDIGIEKKHHESTEQT